MNKKIAIALFAILSAATPALAGQPFRYNTKCYLETTNQEDTCVVVETRDSNGALKTRNIFSNRFGLTIKLRWDGQKFIQWDSANKFEYSFPYQVNQNIQEDGITGTRVMPGFTLVNVSWD